jgi:hypothetical protein
MTEKIKILLLAVLLALGLMLASFAAGWKIRGEKMQPPVADTIRIERVDTVTLVEPRDTLIRIVWKPYPVAVHDTTLIHRHTTDSIWLSLPYEHRYMAKEDTLEVWYSGIEPCIDSAKVYMHHTTEIVNHVPDVRKMVPRLTIDLGAGAFYHERQVFPYASAEMRYNAKQTTFSAYGAIDHQARWAAGVSVTYRMNIIK